ncbi:hypothetical protein QRQ56_34095 [Bradyrhizobium sp. U531]|uniref:HORMA-1 domain-containing protein n=1 Tax=Bradyrhizobium sp. U531 TaxID=3053458 RepID=UPI003F43F784
MSNSYSISESASFTVTHARHMAAKVATDLKRVQRFYGVPSDSDIADYETEVIELLKAGYMGTVTFGFKRNDTWIPPTLRYTAQDLAGMTANDDDPGRIPAGADVSNARFSSFLTYSAKWDALTSDRRDAFKKSLPHYRTGADEPGVDGYFSSDKTYSSGGQALNRDTVRSWK